MKLKPKHQEFIINYLRTKDPGVAYKMTYPRAGIKSLYAAASRLMARPDVAAVIADAEESVRDRALNELAAEQSTDLKEELLSINQKRDILAKIITGKTKRTRHLKARYGVTTVQEEQPVDSIIRAIDLDTRLEMFYNFLIGKNTPNGRRAQQQVYINAPTLQQQVNILIAQSQQQEEDLSLPNAFGTGGVSEQDGDAPKAFGDAHEIQNEKELSLAGGGVSARDGGGTIAHEIQNEKELSHAGGGVSARDGGGTIAHEIENEKDITENSFPVIREGGSNTVRDGRVSPVKKTPAPPFQLTELNKNQTKQIQPAPNTCGGTSQKPTNHTITNRNHAITKTYSKNETSFASSY